MRSDAWSCEELHSGRKGGTYFVIEQTEALQARDANDQAESNALVCHQGS
jgi:hypothetical protein